MLVARLAQFRQVAVCGNPHAAFALNGLEHDRDDVRVFRKCALDGDGVVERHAFEAFDQRREPVLQLARRRSADGRQRAAVECAFDNQDLRLLDIALVAVLARDLECAFDRLGAGIGDECAVHAR